MKNRLYILLFTIGTSIFSCSDYLDTEPSFALTAENAFNSFDKAGQSVGSIYASLVGDAWAGGLYVAQASKAGFIDWRIRDFEFDYNQSSNAVGVTDYWRAYYTTINRANFAIEGITNMDENLVPSEEERNAILAEARCLRAWGHINVLWNFGHWWADDNNEFGVLYRDEFVDDISKISKARLSVGESYQKIYGDLDFAIEHLGPYTVGYNVNIKFAKALKAKILLYRGSYNNVNDLTALQEALALVNEVLDLSTNNDNFLSIQASISGGVYGQAWFSRENLFCNLLETGRETRLAGTYYNTLIIEEGEVMTSPRDTENKTAGLRYGAELFREDERWPRITGAVRSGRRFDQTRYYSWKKLARGGANASSGPSAAWASYFLRLSEVYIMKAELLARTGASISEAIAPIIEMRSGRRFPTSLFADFANPDVNTELNPANEEELMETIFYEYFFETFLENGSEFFASLRFHKNGSQWIETIKGEALQENKLCWPIPEEEMLGNDLMQQNPDLN